MTDGRAAQPDAQGDLQRYPFPRLLFYLCKKRFLGQLSLGNSKIRGLVYFRDGLPVFTDLPLPLDRLGQVLVERGIIAEEQLYAALQQQAQHKLRLGQLLLQQGALDVEGLISALRIQLGRKLNRVFAVSDARFAIYGGEHGLGLKGEEAHVRADPLALIYNGVCNAFDTKRLTPELQKIQGRAIQLRGSFSQIWKRYGFSDELTALVALLMRGPLRVEDLFKMSNVGQLQTQMLLYTLWVTETLDVSTPSSEVPKTQLSEPGPLTLGEVPSVAALTSAPEASGAPVMSAQYTVATPAAGAAPAGTAPVSSAEDEEEDEPRVIQSAPTRGEAKQAEEAEAGQEGVYQMAEIASAAPQETSDADATRQLRKPGSNATSSRGKIKDAAASAEQHQRIKKMYKLLQDQASHYELLDVAQDANKDAIRSAYFKLAKELHPDRVASLGLDELAEQAAEVFRAVNEAHSTLADADKRASYDEELADGGAKKKEIHDALSAEFTFQRGIVALRKKSYAEALECFREAETLSPGEGEHLAYVAWTQFCDPKTDKDKLLPELREMLLRACKLSPKSADCQHFLGEIQLALGEEAKAFRCFEAVLEIKPNHMEANRNLRLMRMRQGKKGKGKDKKGGGLLGRFKRK